MPFGSFPSVISQPTGGSGTSGGGTSGGTSGGGTSGGTSGGTTVDAYTKTESDAKYRTITDSYGKSDPWTNNGTGVILVKQPYSIRTIQGISPVSVALDGTNNMVQVSVDSYTKNESDTKYRTITDSYTRTESDNAYRTKADSYSKTEVYSKTEGDTKYRTIADSYSKSDPWTNNGTGVILVKQPYSIRTIQGISPVSVALDGTNNMVQVSVDSYTKTESDNTYRTKADSYTKTESDNTYRTKADSYSQTQVYTKTESDNTFLKTQKVLVAGGDEAANGFSLVESDHVLRRLKAGTNVTITPSENQLLIDASGGTVVDAYTKTEAAMWFIPVRNTSDMNMSHWFFGSWVGDSRGGLRVDRFWNGVTYNKDTNNFFPALYVDLASLTIPDRTVVFTFPMQAPGFVMVNVKRSGDNVKSVQLRDGTSYSQTISGNQNDVITMSKFIKTSSNATLTFNGSGNLVINAICTSDDINLTELLVVDAGWYMGYDGTHLGWRLDYISQITPKLDTGVIASVAIGSAIALQPNVYVNTTELRNKCNGKGNWILTVKNISTTKKMEVYVANFSLTVYAQNENNVIIDTLQEGWDSPGMWLGEGNPTNYNVAHFAIPENKSMNVTYTDSDKKLYFKGDWQTRYL